MSHFNDEPQSYKAEGLPETKYNNLKQANADRYANLLAQNHNLRRFLYAALWGIVILSCTLAYMSTKSAYIPFYVGIDSETGMAKAIGPATEYKYVPKEAEEKYFLADFIKKVRTVSLDPVAYRVNRDEASYFLTSSAANKMNGMLQQEKFLANLGERTVQPNILVVQQMAGAKNTYQVRWVEDIYSLSGTDRRSVNMSGIFTFEFSPPKDERVLKVNPLGIYITDLSWSKESELKK